MAHSTRTNSASARKIADACDVVDALYVIAHERGAPFSITAAELARRCAAPRFTPMRVGAAALEAVQTLTRLGWQIAYKESRGKAGGIKMFTVTYARTLGVTR
jgi:hypothetical protein